MNREVAGLSLAWKLAAELAVIVAGVLIALGADSWWEQREEHRRAEQYLEQLLVDFKSTERQIQSTIAEDEKTSAAASRVIDGAYHGRYPPTDSLELPTGYQQFRPLTGTLTALVQGGDLRLLESDTLRFELVAYSATVDEVETVLRHTEAMIWNSTEHVIGGRVRHSRSALRSATSGGSGWGQVDVAGALNDPEVISALQVQAVASRIRLFNLRHLEKPTSRLIGLIQAELGDR
jgi:hypothetical protein